jgi:hypothetical protein
MLQLAALRLVRKTLALSVCLFLPGVQLGQSCHAKVPAQMFLLCTTYYVMCVCEGSKKAAQWLINGSTRIVR